MNRDKISGNWSSPSAELHKEIRIEESEAVHSDSEIADRERCDPSVLKKPPGSRKSSSIPPISPLQSFMGKLMLSKQITRIVEDNARTPAQQKLILSTAAEARRGSERWASASAFSSATMPTPISTLSSPLPSSASKSRPSMLMIADADLPFLLPPVTKSASTLDASTFAESLKLSSTRQLDTTTAATPTHSPETSERGERMRSPRASSAPIKPRRRHSSDLSLSPIR